MKLTSVSNQNLDKPSLASMASKFLTDMPKSFESSASEKAERAADSLRLFEKVFLEKV